MQVFRNANHYATMHSDVVDTPGASRLSRQTISRMEQGLMERGSLPQLAASFDSVGMRVSRWHTITVRTWLLNAKTFRICIVGNFFAYCFCQIDHLFGVVRRAVGDPHQRPRRLSPSLIVLAHTHRRFPVQIFYSKLMLGRPRGAISEVVCHTLAVAGSHARRHTN